MHSGIFSLHKLNTLFSHTYYRYIPYCIYSKNVLHSPMCGKQELMAKLTAVKRLTWQISLEQPSHWIKSYLLIILIFFLFFLFFPAAIHSKVLVKKQFKYRNFISDYCTLYIFQSLQLLCDPVLWITACMCSWLMQKFLSEISCKQQGKINK